MFPKSKANVDPSADWKVEMKRSSCGFEWRKIAFIDTSENARDIEMPEKDVGQLECVICIPLVFLD